MKMIVGLGNPGKRYHLTRHNVGFDAVDNFCRINGLACQKNKFGALYGEGSVAGKKVLVVKPQQYMNISGQPVASMKGYYKVADSDIIVVCDDMDLETGKIRLSKTGGAGGHNGLKSLMQALGSGDFARLRIGIGRPDNQNIDPSDHVLGRISGPDTEKIENALVLSVSALECFVKDDIELCMNRFN